MACASVIAGSCISSDHNLVITTLKKTPKLVNLKYYLRWMLRVVDWSAFRAGQDSILFDERMDPSSIVNEFESKVVKSAYVIHKSKDICNPKYSKSW